MPGMHIHIAVPDIDGILRRQQEPRQRLLHRRRIVGIGIGFSMRARISGSFSRATRMTSRARGAAALEPNRPPCSTSTDMA